MQLRDFILKFDFSCNKLILSFTFKCLVVEANLTSDNNTPARYVTDHVALCRDVSNMYKWLAVFEDDEKRKTIMCTLVNPLFV